MILQTVQNLIDKVDRLFARTFFRPLARAERFLDVERHTERIECAKHEANRSARFSLFDGDNPLTADADLAGKRSLVDSSLSAQVAQECAEFECGTNDIGWWIC